MRATNAHGAATFRNASALTAALVKEIEQNGLSVAAAARSEGVSVTDAGPLVQQHVIGLEAQGERLDDIDRQCPGWWSYTDNQLTRIFRGSTIPNPIVRELVEEWQVRTGELNTGRLATRVGISGEALRRSLGMVGTPGRTKDSYRYPARVRKTITIDAASRSVRALGMPPCEVCGL